MGVASYDGLRERVTEVASWLLMMISALSSGKAGAASGRCETAAAAATSGGRLGAKTVGYASGPIDGSTAAAVHVRAPTAQGWRMARKALPSLPANEPR